jgi:phosphatidylserine/phosphatidylglycerophosphate/cardiolipin synthase-like enzyme
MVIRKGDETIAFCGGLDIAFLRTSADWGPNLLAWHDIHSRLEGLIARDLELEFILRWNREKDRSVVAPQPGWNIFETLNQLSASSVDTDSNRNLHKIQMLRTVSTQGPLIPPAVQRTIRDDIWQGYKRLIGCASQFIFMENQYFREPLLADEIIGRIKDVPKLVVIIIVPSSLDEGSDAITEHGNALQFDFFSRLYNALSPSQFRVYTMYKRFIHSKFILIDDQAMSIGSANANPRGFQLDTELNIIVDQPDVVKSFRQRLWSHDLGISQSTITAWKVTNFISGWDNVANANRKLTGKPDVMTGEGVISFDPRSIKGLRRPLIIPNVLTEAAI